MPAVDDAAAAVAAAAKAAAAKAEKLRARRNSVNVTRAAKTKKAKIDAREGAQIDADALIKDSEEVYAELIAGGRDAGDPDVVLAMVR